MHASAADRLIPDVRAHEELQDAYVEGVFLAAPQSQSVSRGLAVLRAYILPQDDAVSF